MSVKVHTHGSNRERPIQAEKKIVFKAVFDNPFRINWPSIPVNLQNLLLAQTLSILNGVSEYQRSRLLLNRKGKQKQSEENRSRKRKRKSGIDVGAKTNDIQNLPAVAASSESDPTSYYMQLEAPLSNPPEVLAHLTTGINQVTKRLEVLVRARRGRVEDETTLPQIGIVLVCRADVNPPILIDHLPHLVAAYNSTKPSHPILLLSLPQGAEVALSEAMGLRRVAVIAINSDAPGLSTMLSLIPSAPILTASWLATNAAVAEVKRAQSILPTHIKQLRTTAPKDMKTAKEQRAAGRAAAKAKDRDKKKSVVS
ncbi:hypothetical protein F5878DRAFT_551452 [Lentinula raphanica]|uniref:Uncharacterized protein n=1 Tax=Lentinula raphanica TaxID=153919 RepID=A0AA38UKQ2_9AGAR|nr:hypothetical protein F5878DRAFT_551452 [Lentinula raphanica]